MRTADMIISSRWVLPIAPQNICLEDHAVVIADGKILAILKTQQALQQFSTKQHLHLDQHVLMPGLINAHTHTPMTLFRGLADDLELENWLTKHIWPAENALLDAKSVAAGSLLGIAEMIRGGTTCFNDNYFFPEITAEIAAKEGMRACLGIPIFSFPTGWCKTIEEYFTKAKNILQNTPRSPLISWAICPHSPYSVNDAELIKCKQFAQEYHLPIHMHVHETLKEIEQSLQQYNMRPLQRIQQLGLLSDKFISVHSTHLTDQEIKLLKDTGSHVVHCPESNLKLASGFAPIGKLLDANVNIAIGTDGAASNNDLDLFGELKTAALVAKVADCDPTTLSASEALKMATISGAKALGLENEIGSLEVGKYADIIAIDMNHYFTQPIYNPMSHLIYALNRLQVSEVWVAGRHLLHAGKFVSLNTEKMVHEAQYWADKAKPFAFSYEATQANCELKC